MPDQTQQFSFKVLTINIHKGFTAFNRRFILPELRDAVRTVSADIVCLQEVMGAHLKFIRCMWKTGPIPRTTSFSPTLCGAILPTVAMPYTRKGHHGNAVLSRYPIEHYENRDVSVDGAEKRGVLYCRIVPPMTGKAIHVMCIWACVRRTVRRSLRCSPNGSMSCRTANQYWWRVISTTGGKKLIIR